MSPMREYIVREYSHLFEITKCVSVYLEQMIGLSIPDRLLLPDKCSIIPSVNLHRM